MHCKRGKLNVKKNTKTNIIVFHKDNIFVPVCIKIAHFWNLTCAIFIRPLLHFWIIKIALQNYWIEVYDIRDIGKFLRGGITLRILRKHRRNWSTYFMWFWNKIIKKCTYRVSHMDSYKSKQVLWLRFLSQTLFPSHSLIRGVLIQSFSSGAKNYTKCVFYHVQYSGVIQNIAYHRAIKTKFWKTDFY